MLSIDRPGCGRGAHLFSQRGAHSDSISEPSHCSFPRREGAKNPGGAVVVADGAHASTPPMRCDIQGPSHKPTRPQGRGADFPDH